MSLDDYWYTPPNDMELQKLLKFNHEGAVAMTAQFCLDSHEPSPGEQVLYYEQKVIRQARRARIGSATVRSISAWL